MGVVAPVTLENIKLKWNPELKHHCPDTPRVLVGLKTDLREDASALEELAKENNEPITTDKGKAFGDSIGAATYCECSALTQQGLKDVFDTATRAARNAIQAATGIGGGGDAAGGGGGAGASGGRIGGGAASGAKKKEKKGGCILL